METFGARLKELRLKNGMTQKQLAERIGVSKSIISYYEMRERQATGDVIVKLAAVFHVSTDYLLGVDPAPRIEVSGLTEEKIAVLEKLIEFMRE